MSVDCFLDTNILVYAATGGGEDEPKRKRALDLIEQEDFALSAQVLQEFYVTVTRKTAKTLSSDEALEWIEQFEAFPIVEIDAPLVKIGVELSERYQLSYWDGAIVAAAQQAGASVLYTEDLNDSQLLDTVQVSNPFAGLTRPY